ncbi:peptide ABC transporter substrate-binding protein [Leptolyngbya cf. ectocarpi LEGE 11479]|uniref:Peptide ABC transporter substrate-binding protein n=1 Tax=Leptolyngbya cf. ectocarpi LEGE 11479 TaxID=1828722 RepID=A0A928ZPH6_LEPEC|nr:ABC transporter substrate-binding protein [Leptolyngbya ectocarpi]MBE9065200.1 peptide ABC transporter substrate-binding protein [Leptolyngbya cf. ectocarpi LEGE 11479]
MSVQFLGKHRWLRPWQALGYYIGLFSLCFLFAVACGGNEQESSPASDGRVSMGTTLSARTLDPADAYEIFPGILLYNLGDRLYTYAPGTTTLEPQLATEMPTISDDGLTYTIPLREGVTLHDGSGFNAEVMAFSIQRFMDNGGRPAFLLSEKIATVEAKSEYELTITLKQPFAAFTSLLTFWGVTPVPPEAYTIGDAQFKPEEFLGSGPYKLASFSSDVIKLDANPDYWGEAPVNDGIDIQIFSSPANLYNTFQSGGLDVAYQTLDPEQIAALERGADQGGWTVIEAGSTVVNYMSLNQKIAPFDDLNVRKAVATMIDRNLINDRAFQGQAEPLYSLIPKSFDVHEPVFETSYGDGDYGQAKDFLEEAGITTANPLEFEIWYPTSSTTRSVVANTLKEAIESNMSGLVNVQVSTAESATLWENVEKGIYPSVLSNWYPDYFDPDNFVQPFLSCDQGSEETLCEQGATQGNGSFYYSAKTNELLAKQSAELDESVRDGLFKDLQQAMVDDVPYIPLWQNKDYVFAASGVDGVAIEPNQQFLLWQIGK